MSTACSSVVIFWFEDLSSWMGKPNCRAVSICSMRVQPIVFTVHAATLLFYN